MSAGQFSKRPKVERLVLTLTRRHGIPDDEADDLCEELEKILYWRERRAEARGERHGTRLGRQAARRAPVAP